MTLSVKMTDWKSLVRPLPFTYTFLLFFLTQAFSGLGHAYRNNCLATVWTQSTDGWCVATLSNDISVCLAASVSPSRSQFFEYEAFTVSCQQHSSANWTVWRHTKERSVPDNDSDTVAGGSADQVTTSVAWELNLLMTADWRKIGLRLRDELRPAVTAEWRYRVLLN